MALLDVYKKIATFLNEGGYNYILIGGIAASTVACARRKAIKLHGLKAFFPTPEDLILLKLVPGRAKDIADVEGLIARHGNRLDKQYLKTWAMKLCDEAEDMRIWQTLDKLLEG